MAGLGPLRGGGRAIVPAVCFLALGLALAPSFPLAADAAPVASDQQIVARMANLQRLLHQSSGSRRVLGSSNELSKKIRQHAVGLYQQAEQALARGDRPTVERLLNEAAQTMFQALRTLGPATDRLERQVQEFEGRAESTRTLLRALQTIAVEEGAQRTAATTVAGVEKTIAAAREKLQQGNHDDARKLLDGGYEIAKAAVEKFRDGKTLVRELKFDNPESEYRYEVDRNDTHQMLLKVLLQKKGDSAPSPASLAKFVQNATDLRERALKKAEGGDFRDAIRLLELSTKELVRAIRGAGVYIPG